MILLFLDEVKGGLEVADGYLDCRDTEKRKRGLFVVQELSKKKTGQGVDFELSGVEGLLNVIGSLSIQEEKQEQEKQEQDKDEKELDDKDSDDESVCSLTPYPESITSDSSDLEINNTKYPKPKYIPDIITALTSDEPERIQQALNSIETIIHDLHDLEIRIKINHSFLLFGLI